MKGESEHELHTQVPTAKPFTLSVFVLKLRRSTGRQVGTAQLVHVLVFFGGKELFISPPHHIFKGLVRPAGERRGGTQFAAHPCVTYQTWHQILVSNVSQSCIPPFRAALTEPVQFQNKALHVSINTLINFGRCVCFLLPGNEKYSERVPGYVEIAIVVQSHLSQLLCLLSQSQAIVHLLSFLSSASVAWTKAWLQIRGFWLSGVSVGTQPTEGQTVTVSLYTKKKETSVRPFGS